VVPSPAFDYAEGVGAGLPAVCLCQTYRISGFTAAARQIAAVVTSGVSHRFRGVRAVFLQLPAYGHYSYRFERGMRISRTTLDMWELLELCDSGEAVVQVLMYGLTDCVRCRRDLRRLPQV
jgi:hypothetical protein